MFNKVNISQYIGKINRDDIINFGIKQGIYINKNDVDLIYYYIKNRCDDIIDNPDNILNEIEYKLDKNVYLKILELYNKYKYFFK